MVGFAVMSFRENRWGGLIAQGLGTSMLQMGNIIRRPQIWLPTIITSAVTGPLSTAVLHNEHAVLSASTLMTGQYGEEGIFTSLPCVIGAEGEMGAFQWIGLVLICVVIPAVLTLALSELMLKLKLYKSEDMKLDL